MDANERLKPIAYLIAAVAGGVLVRVVLKDGSAIEDCVIKAFSHDDLLLNTTEGDVLVNRTEVRLIRGVTNTEQKSLEGYRG